MLKFTNTLIKMMLAVILIGLLQACIKDKEEPVYSLEAGSSLPSFSFTLIDGEVIDTSSLSETGIDNLIILFFNTDCIDCQRELPNIQRLYEIIISDESLRDNTCLACIAREEDATAIRSYWLEHNLTLPVSPQTDRRIYNMFANIGIPRMYLARTTTKTITAAWDDDDTISISDVLQMLR